MHQTTTLPPDLWLDIEQHVMELMVAAYAAGIAAAAGHSATPDDTYMAALLRETRRRWREGLEAPPAAEIPSWLRDLQGDDP